MTPEREAQMREAFEAHWVESVQKRSSIFTKAHMTRWHDTGKYMAPGAEEGWQQWLACARALEPIEEARRMERGKLLDEIAHICRLFLDDADGKYNATSCFIAILGKTVDGHKQMKNDAAMSAALEDGNATE